MILRSLIPLYIFINTARAGCPFQNPFFFIDRPSVLTVVDSDGKMVPDRFEKNEVDGLDKHIDNVTELESAGARWRTLSAWITSR